MADKIILLAEDDASHEALIRRAVEESGLSCRLEVVHDGVETIDYIFGVDQQRQGKEHKMPDLILLDLKMPRMNGLQVLQVLHRVRTTDRKSIPPVVVLTSSINDQDVAKAYRWGAQSYICKPLGFPEFARAVRQTLEYWFGLNRSAPPVRVRV